MLDPKRKGIILAGDTGTHDSLLEAYRPASPLSKNSYGDYLLKLLKSS